MARRWESKFLSGLADGANVTKAAEAAGITRQTAYLARREDDEFAAKWDAALNIGVGTLEDEAVRRAVEGVEEPIYQRGEYCGTLRKYSDALLMFLLKAHKPAVYNPPQRNEVSGKDGGPVEQEVKFDFSGLSVEQITAILGALPGGDSGAASGEGA